ncbi:hypothetical protein ACIP5Y_00245 [Nocardia sp. NPDC088792]|uniref:hypothetical protein n=1 Tax=Nocardia sp. NPDC088792 TaxID=3364332 RepID=UPI0037FFA4FB
MSETRRKNLRPLRSRKHSVSLFFIALLFLASACGGSKSATPSEAALSTAIPGGFDPCHGIPAKVLDGENLNTEPSTRTKNNDKVKEEGCFYYPTAQGIKDGDVGIGIEVLATNMTYDYFRGTYANDPGHSIGKQLEIGNRPSATLLSDTKGMCQLFVSVKGGGIKFDTLTHKGDPCQVLIDFANKISPQLPPAN